MRWWIVGVYSRLRADHGGMTEVGPEEEENDDDCETASFHIVLPSPRRIVFEIKTQVHEQLSLAATSIQACFMMSTRFIASRFGKSPGIKSGVAAALEKATAFSKSDLFNNMVQKAFDEVDFDKSGTVDATEVYCMVLLLYMKIQSVAQVKPPKKEQVDKLVKHFDLDKNKTLDRNEFVALATILGENIAMRVAAENAIKLLMAPMIAAQFVFCLEFMWKHPRLQIGTLNTRYAIPAFTASVVSGFIVSMVAPAVVASVDNQLAVKSKRSAKGARAALKDGRNVGDAALAAARA